MDALTESLVLRATSGDRAAIEVLLEQHLPELRGFIARRAGAVGARESAADVAQSVCREVLEHLRDRRLRFLGDAEFKQWLYRAAVLKLSSRRRYWASAGRGEIAAAAPLASDSGALPSPQLAPSHEAAALEEMERLAELLDRLSEPQRDAIVLFHVDGRSHAEIAERLGVTEAYSRTMLSRAMARLARYGANPPSPPVPGDP